jgi:translocator protein
MSVIAAIFSSLGVCMVGAILEGLAAGNNVKPFFAQLRFPAYSAPLWVWYIIGALYYFICFIVLYRLFRYHRPTALWIVALILILVVMATNALWNYVFFRAKKLRGAFVLGLPYGLVAIGLFFCLRQFDQVAAWALVPYLVYLIYGFCWGYGLWKLNRPSESQISH